MLEKIVSSSPGTNTILAKLPSEDARHIQRNARILLLRSGRALYQAGEALHSVYFPTSCVVSHSHTTLDGVSASMALTGNEGIVGLSALLNAAYSAHAAVIQVAGYALKVATPVVRSEFARAGLLQRVVLQYTHVLITQLAANAICNRLHSLEQRLCRSLLLCHDRAHSDELAMTQESIASMIGGRRESVTVAAGRLQDLGFIRNTRGCEQILDRGALRALACECYASTRDILES